MTTKSTWECDAIVLKDLQELPRKLYETRKSISMRGVRDAPDWLGYETAIWKLSENLREYLKAHRKLRGKNIVLDAVARIVTTREYGKGRQNFVLILGAYGGDPYGRIIANLLNDPEVYGHAIKALTNAKVSGLDEEIAEILLTEKVAWIRAAGKRYLERVSKF